jgi:hypothetical protein
MLTMTIPSNNNTIPSLPNTHQYYFFLDEKKNTLDTQLLLSSGLVILEK